MNIGYCIVLIFFLFIYQIPAFLIVLIEFPLQFLFGKFIKFDYKKHSNYLVRIGLYLTDKTFFKTIHIIHPSIDLSKRYICMLNHQSYADPVVGGIIKNETMIPVIGYLKYIPLLGYNAIISGSPFVPEKPKKLVSMEKTKPNETPSGGITDKMKDILRKNTNATLTMFPEGKRTFCDDILLTDIKTGGFVVARDLGIDIIPVYHNIIDRFDDKKMEYSRKKQVYCIWGEPISVKGKEIDQLVKEYFTSIKNLRNECIAMKNKKD